MSQRLLRHRSQKIEFDQKLAIECVIPSLITRSNKDIGDRDARDGLLDMVSDLRERLMGGFGINLLESMELQYLHYLAGTSHNDGDDGGTRKKKDGRDCNGTRTSGFYWRHFNRTGDKDGPLARRVSLLLYLNNDGWDAHRDGGGIAHLCTADKGTGWRRSQRRR
jgi:hypothetical protein